MKRITKRALALVLAFMFLLSACTTGNDAPGQGAKEGENGKIIRTSNGSEPGSLDPALGIGTHDAWITQHVFEGLMKLDENGQLVPGMAKDKPEISEDGLHYKFTLRDDIKWSNGDPVTAYDFEYAWKHALDPETASDYGFQLFYIKGAENYSSGKGTVDDVQIRAVDEKTLEFDLEVPTPYFLDLTTFWTLYPVNKNVAEKNPDWAKNADTFVSNGPFQLTEWKHNDIVSIRKFADYYDADKVKIDGVDFEMLEEKNTQWQNYKAGQYDVVYAPISNVTAQLLNEKNPELKLDPELGTYYFLCNTKEKPFNNVKVRMALSMAIDREVIVEKVTQGGQKPATGMVSYGLQDDTGKDFAEAQGNLLKYDVQEAKKLLDEGLKEENMTIEDLNKKVLVYNTSEDHQKICQAIQDMWKNSLGVELGLENTDFQVLLDNRHQGNFDICRAGFLGDFNDPMTFLSNFYSTNSRNDGKFVNEEYDKLLDTARKSSDQKERMDSMKAAEKILMENVPCIPIYFYNKTYLVKPNIEGIYSTTTSLPSMIYAEFK